MATAKAKARASRIVGKCAQQMLADNIEFCDTVEALMPKLCTRIERLQQEQLAFNSKRSQEIDNRDTTVTPTIIYPSSPSSEELAMMHAGLAYRKVMTAEELEEEYPSK